MPIRAERLTSQLLAGQRPRDPVAVAERLLAIQAQDWRGARLAIRARCRELSSGDLAKAFTQDRSLLITTLNRGTLQLVRSEDYAWLHALTTPPLRTGNARRLSQEGVSASAAERGIAVIERALADDGPLDRNRLRDLVRAADVPTSGQAFVHLLMLASNRGLIVRGPLVDGNQAYVLVRDWLDAAPPFDRSRALAELARRFLAGHGPAEERDLARWAGLPVRDARAGLRAIAPELNRGTDGLIDLKRRVPAASLPEPRLLGAFEPAVVGWRSRQWLLGDHEARVVSGGVFRPLALVRGRAAGTWRISRRGVEIAPFGRLARADLSALESDAEEVVSFLRVGATP
jgi:Winged helix DNA-binding domain